MRNVVFLCVKSIFRILQACPGLNYKTDKKNAKALLVGYHEENFLAGRKPQRSRTFLLPRFSGDGFWRERERGRVVQGAVKRMSPWRRAPCGRRAERSIFPPVIYLFDRGALSTEFPFTDERTRSKGDELVTQHR